MSGRHLQRGAAETLEFLTFNLDEAERHIAEGVANIRRNPGLCEDALNDARRDLDRVRAQLAEITAMLERRALRDDLVAATEALREALAHFKPPDDDDNVTELRPRRQA